MSDCGVCIYIGDADCSPEFFDVAWRKARKQHKCSECLRTIDAGQMYQSVRGKWDGDFSEFKTCAVCAEIREAFSCDGVMYGGQFWEYFAEVISELNESCFDKLQTPEAKKYLRERWMEWKGLPI